MEIDCSRTRKFLDYSPRKGDGMGHMMESKQTIEFVNRFWDESILPALREYIRIPCKSVAFDPDWKQNGHIDAAKQLVVDWVNEHKPRAAKLHVVEVENRTPVLLIEIPGTTPELDSRTVLLYGHLDKQPEMTGWREGLGPWKDVYIDGKLYGRGGSDDGYAVFSSVACYRYFEANKIPHTRALILIEFSEESGSPDLPFYVDYCKDKIGTPELVVCLDSGAGNYDQLWCTTSLRGILAGVLRVEVLKEGVHSGASSGIVPSSFRIARQLLSRIEDEKTGKILLPELHVDIPEARATQAKLVAEVLGDHAYDTFPFVDGMRPANEDTTELLLQRTWKPALSTIAQEGMPSLQQGGNVLRPYTSLKLSIRIPPGVDLERASQALSRALTSDPPYNARVRFEPEAPTQGWNAPTVQPWLAKALDESSKRFYGKPALYIGEGGTIPFMYMLAEKFPKAQFVVTGVLGPNSNAHGPNEFLHVPYAKRLTACVSEIIFEHAKQ
jgi:acetylornithine deacetylase/succinyl-diaminopimelate desuccinylase-like protein